MKRKLFITTLIVGFLVVGAQTIAEEPDAHPLHGTWTLNYEWVWAGDSPAETGEWYITMYTQKFGAFSDNFGDGGWVLNPSPNKVLLIYTSYCRAVYFSKNFNGQDFMSGFMWTREDGSCADWGTWDATKQ